MTRNRSTKSALISSVVALFLCFTMLLGTTYAWFTDSVASGSNVITAGNLDIKVEYTLDGENWDLLDGANDLFQMSLWEPGHTEVVALRITNEGSLALKYTATMNIVEETYGTNKAGEPIVLSEILTVSTLRQQTGTVGDITVDLAFGGENRVAYETTVPFKAAGVIGTEKELLPGNAHYLIVKVDMADTVGNEANAKDKDSLPSIEFGINVMATQYAYEEDSFDNQYDAAATYMNKNADGAWEITNVGELLLFAKNVNLGITDYAGETVVLANDIDLAGINWMGIGNWSYAFCGTFDGQGHTVSNLTINRPSAEGIGFFGVVQNATIKDFTIKNVSINAYSMVAAAVGAAYPATISGVNVTGNINIVSEWAYVAGVAGYCYYGTQVDDCSVIADGMGSITSETRNAVGGITAWLLEGDHKVTNCDVANLNLTGWTNIGGITGFVHYNNTIDGCTVENVNMTKTRIDGHPGIGLISGGWSYNANNAITLSNNSLKNITLNGSAVYKASANYLYGSEYGGADNSNFVLSGNTEDGIVNNLIIADADKMEKVATAADLQAALNNVTENTVIQLTADIAGDFAVAQHPEARIVIDGNGHEFAGTLVVDGKSSTITSAGIVIRNVVFKADSINADACIRLGDGTTATRYTCNVTVSNCTFDVPGAVGVKSYTGGDKNLIITGCTATANAHSLAQIAGADNVVVENCKVYSKNGANFNQTTNVTVTGSTFDVKGYAVRFGAGSGDSALVETYLIKDCAMKSACTDADDAVIVLRGTADYATLTIENTTIEGTRDILNTATDANVIVK